LIEQNKQSNCKLIEENVKTNKYLEFLCNRIKRVEEMVESDNSGDNIFIKVSLAFLKFKVYTYYNSNYISLDHSKRCC
jgi:hypothetical protein